MFLCVIALHLAALQFDTSVYQGIEEENLDQKSPGPPGWGLVQQASPLLVGKKIALKSIGNTLDRCNLRRHKLRKRSIRLGTLNLQGIRNKTGEL